MASPTGTALIPTQGSCLPLTDIVVFFPNLFIVFLLFKIEDVGLTANEQLFLALKKYLQVFHPHY